MTSLGGFNLQVGLIQIYKAFHTAAQRDSNIQVRVGLEAHKETVAMKTIAIVAMAFLPPTFVSVSGTLFTCDLMDLIFFQSIFSMSFFHFDPADGNRNASFTLSRWFWMYWAFAVPLSAATLALWFFWDRDVAKNYPKETRLRAS